MSDAVKWALLAAAAVAIIAMVMALPFVNFADMGAFGTCISHIVRIASDGFLFGKGLINNFLTPFGRTVFNGLLGWLFGKWAIMNGIKIMTGIYHFIFK